MRELSNEEMYHLTANLFNKEMSSRGNVIKHFQQLLITHQDMAYSDNNINKKLVYKTTLLLSKLAKDKPVPKKFQNYKKLSNIKN